MSLEDDVIVGIVPDREEEARLRGVIRELSSKIKELAKKWDLNAEPLLVGSVAKGTHMKGAEIDMFVSFPKSTSREDLEKWGLRFGEVLSQPRRMYAEHPYTHGFFLGTEAEVVPCYRLESPEEKMSAVDRTPFHTEYVMAKLDENLRREVRLLKQFAKGIGTYGAEAKIQGFSGYLCELLIIKYGGFRKLLKDARRWRPGTLIELERKAAKEFMDPLIVMDPVDPGRNVASALSMKQFSTFVLASREYLKGPKIEFFFPNPLKRMTKTAAMRRMNASGSSFVALVFKAPEVTDDILYPQLRKCHSSLVDLLQRYDFSLVNSDFFVANGDILILFQMKAVTLPRVKKHFGPPVWLRNSMEFIQKWREAEETLAGPYVEDGRLAVDIKREYTDARSLLREKMPTLSLGKNLDEAIKRGFRLISEDSIARKKFLGPLTEFLTRKFPWER